jgi:hypothetical protein
MAKVPLASSLPLICYLISRIYRAGVPPTTQHSPGWVLIAEGARRAACLPLFQLAVNKKPPFSEEIQFLLQPVLLPFIDTYLAGQLAKSL